MARVLLLERLAHVWPILLVARNLRTHSCELGQRNTFGRRISILLARVINSLKVVQQKRRHKVFGGDVVYGEHARRVGIRSTGHSQKPGVKLESMCWGRICGASPDEESDTVLSDRTRSTSSADWPTHMPCVGK